MDQVLKTITQLIVRLKGGAQLTAADRGQLKYIIRHQRQSLKEQRELQGRYGTLRDAQEGT